MTDTTQIDAAVLVYRADPSEENRQALLDAQQRHFDDFCREQTIEYQRRTHGDS